MAIRQISAMVHYQVPSPLCGKSNAPASARMGGSSRASDGTVLGERN